MVPDHAAPASVQVASTDVSTSEVPGAACVLSSAMPPWRSRLSPYTGSSGAQGHSAASSCQPLVGLTALQGQAASSRLPECSCISDLQQPLAACLRHLQACLHMSPQVRPPVAFLVSRKVAPRAQWQASLQPPPKS